MEPPAPSLVVLALCALAGCATLPPLPRVPEHAAGPVPLGLASDGPTDSTDVRIGDMLALSVHSDGARKDSSVVVDGSGQVHVAAGCDVKVAGASLEQAERQVRDALRKLDRFAEVELRPLAPGSRQIGVLGAVGKPGPLALIPGMRVIDAVAAAGGLLMSPSTQGPSVPIADLDRAVLLREGQVAPVSMRAAVQATPGHNVYLHAGDYLYIPFVDDERVSVFGQVNGPSVLFHRPGLRLTEALSSAGGLTTEADKDDIRVVRGSVEAPQVYRASLADIADGDEPDVVLAAGDAVFVEDDPIEDAGELFGFLLPLSALALAGAALALALP